MKYIPIIIALCILACTKKETDSNSPIVVNNVLPKDNNAMLELVKKGTTGKGTSIYNIKVSSIDKIYFSGIHEGIYVVGLMDESFNTIWEYQLSYKPTQIEISTSQTVSVDEGILVFGNVTIGSNSQSVITSINKNGQLYNDIILNAYSYVNLADIERINSYQNKDIYIVTGSAGISNENMFGYIDYFIFDNTTGKIYKSDNSYTFSNTKLFTDYPQTVFSDAVLDTYTAGIPSQTFKVACYSYNASYDDREKAAFAKISIDKSTVSGHTYYSNPVIEWYKEVPIIRSFKRTFIKGDGALIDLGIDGMIGIGYGESTEGKVISNNGTFFNSCLAVRCNNSGNIIWTKEYSLSDHSDHFKYGILKNGSIYVAGNQSSYIITSNNSNFGNGLVARVDISNGDMLSYKTFGGGSYFSDITAITLSSDESKFLLAGYTEYYGTTIRPGFKSWLFKLNTF